MEYPVKNVKNGWDVDLHIHTCWSLDIPKGPKPEDYLNIAEENKIHIGFLDHYEILYQNTSLDEFPPHKKWIQSTPLDDISKYLEKMDELKSNYSFISSGVEIDYYPYLEDELRNFVDDFGKEFNLLVGSMHEIEPFRPVTLVDDIRELIKKYGSFKTVVDNYFDLEERMIKTGIFKAIAHPDIIFRFCGIDFIPMKDEYLKTHERTEKIAQLCKEEDVWMEMNLSGYRFDVNRPFPPISSVKEFLQKGVKMYIGSDVHSVAQMEFIKPKIHEMNDLMRSIQN
ncbi:MAG: hypothetical protein GY870_14000 [archaeon]|nr:hypothetical protein [archaeon]